MWNFSFTVHPSGLDLDTFKTICTGIKLSITEEAITKGFEPHFLFITVQGESKSQYEKLRKECNDKLRFNLNRRFDTLDKVGG